MAPAIPSAELRLSYPLYALDFDPQDANRLVVGGGGGAARSGVGNKVSVLDVSREDSIQIVSELELSRDEDSVNTLAVGPRRGDSLLFYTGINSAEADLRRGKNEHFRVFTAGLHPHETSKKDPPISELSRSSLFTTTDTEAYQRLLRMSGQVGAVATGTIGRSKDAQIAVFDIPGAASGSPAPKPRGTLELVKEAMDMDMMQISDDEHQLVYCDDYNLYVLNIGKTDTDGPHCVFTMPHDESSGASARPSFRCIRYLTPTFVLAVANLPQARGAVLQGFRLPRPSDLGREEQAGKARLAVSAKLPKSVARATGIAVRNLSPAATPPARTGDTQFAIAVTGQDSSITLYALDHQTMGDVNLIANPRRITTLKEVHQGPISGVAFSPLTPRTSSKPSTSPSPSDPSTQRPPRLKLASIGSMGNTCVLHSLPLRQLASPKQAPASTPRKEQQESAPRYVLALQSSRLSAKTLLLGTAVLFALVALLLQGLLEVRGLARPVVGARALTPVSWHSPGRYYGLSSSSSSVESSSDSSDSTGQLLSPTEGVLAAYHRAVAAFSSSYSAADGAAAGGGEEKEEEEREKMKKKQPVAVVVVSRVSSSEKGGKGDREGGGGGEVKEEDEGEVVVEGHDEQRHGEAKPWEELHPAQREAWKERLKKAGHWAEGMGEAVLKGVVFGEIAGAVGAMVA